MKKVKVMLTAIAVMAVVGGALAFRERSYNQTFCTRFLVQGPGRCLGWYNGKLATPVQPGNFYYTFATGNTLNCGQFQCQISTSLTVMEP
jgi:hypothetical protein